MRDSMGLNEHRTACPHSPELFAQLPLKCSRLPGTHQPLITRQNPIAPVRSIDRIAVYQAIVASHDMHGAARDKGLLISYQYWITKDLHDELLKCLIVP